MDMFVKMFNSDDYIIDVLIKIIGLLDIGIDKVENYFYLNNLYDFENVVLIYYIDNVFWVNYIMLLNIDYVVSEE